MDLLRNGGGDAIIALVLRNDKDPQKVASLLMREAFVADDDGPRGGEAADRQRQRRRRQRRDRQERLHGTPLLRVAAGEEGALLKQCPMSAQLVMNVLRVCFKQLPAPSSCRFAAGDSEFAVSYSDLGRVWAFLERALDLPLVSDSDSTHLLWLILLDHRGINTQQCIREMCCTGHADRIEDASIEPLHVIQHPWEAGYRDASMAEWIAEIRQKMAAERRDGGEKQRSARSLLFSLTREERDRCDSEETIRAKWIEKISGSNISAMRSITPRRLTVLNNEQRTMMGLLLDKLRFADAASVPSFDGGGGGGGAPLSPIQTLIVECALECKHFSIHKMSASFRRSMKKECAACGRTSSRRSQSSCRLENSACLFGSVSMVAVAKFEEKMYPRPGSRAYKKAVRDDR
eukprot:TRINITY_DN2449_c0_g1_i1.p1 TRINITY_DN2449_c0_g1~~TRINITY_DN2449_c0_g1_i1.p1  ORF type:complete len:404 (-),score=66.79 TRINITY_DN2449_c0_g1_i1:2449-3660(-)